MFIIRWLWKNMKGDRALYIFALFLTIICQSMYIITPYFTQQIVDTFIVGENAAENLRNGTDRLIAMIALMIGFTVIRCAIQYSANLSYEKTSQGLIYRIRKVLFDKIEQQDATFYDRFRTGDIMTRVTGDLDMIRHSVAWIIKTTLECIILFSVTTIYFISIDWIMAICMIALTPVILIITKKFKDVVGPFYVDLREKLSDLNTCAEENISGNRVVKAFAREEFEIDKFDKRNKGYNEANKKAAFTWLRFFPGLEITAQSLAVVCLICGGLFVIMGRITPGEYAAFSGLIWTISNPMRTLGNIVNDYQRFTASANKIIELYYAHPAIIDRADAVELGRRVEGKIEFRNVTFAYGKNEILKDISFTVNPGEKVAIMGATGSGKTTLINLIPRIYDVTGGEILVDGINVRMMKLKELRGSIGIATQDVLLYSDTIDGNICFGNVDLPEEEVKKYAQCADAHNFILKTSDGYDTIIGERGVGLSGGQKQRISLARALAVKPSILILDDTTSAVDLETEKRIQDALANLDYPCTKIIVAQRISSAKDADRIIILKDGKIAEMGTHDELIKTGGYYSEVYELQK
ncbi:MAG: ABC transporter ATP-binding protein [Ruminiclostridium sp.]|nr:ABC transporter ATP-binding protein [Ruminiclostridium sp.]